MQVVSTEMILHYKAIFCCDTMGVTVSHKDKPLYFDEVNKLYYFHIHYRPYVQLIRYCLWCLKKLVEHDMSCDYSKPLFYKLYLKDDCALYDVAMMPQRFQNDDQWNSYGMPNPGYEVYVEVEDQEKATKYMLGPYDPSCCSMMHKAIEDPYHAIEYVPLFRHYILRFDYSAYYGELIKNCPWCATAFPISLYKEYQRLILENIEFEDDFFDLGCYIEDFPQEFQTDEWWKKRGL